jgi:hypothetical protein
MTWLYGWQRFYEAAVVETNPLRLPVLIQSARAAIDARIQQLVQDHQGTADERQAISDAIAGLDLLRKELD